MREQNLSHLMGSRFVPITIYIAKGKPLTGTHTNEDLKVEKFTFRADGLLSAVRGPEGAQTNQPYNNNNSLNFGQ
jgi:hypothetical protein